MELEFVTSLANPDYIQYLATTSPHLFPQEPATSDKSASKKTAADDNSDSACFARYLKYLHDYWRKPEYAQYLSHPAATLRNLELLQNEQFRRDVVRQDVIDALRTGFRGVGEVTGAQAQSAEGEVAQGAAEENTAANSTSGGANAPET